MKCQSFSLVYTFATASLCTGLLWSSASITGAAEPGLETAKIESITGLKGALNEKEDTFKISKPKNDVPISVDQASMAPFMGLTSWATFMPGGKADAMAMGDMVLFEDEVNPVMSAALEKGLAVTALHNHFFFDKPRVYFMHIGGEGTVERLAEGVRAIFDKEKEIRSANPQPADFVRDRTAPGEKRD
jgi:hypothetical protein